MDSSNLEQTLVLIKPDALKNSLTGYILSLLAETHSGLIFAAAKVVAVSRTLAEEHYAEHKGKVFFPSLLEYLTGALHYPMDTKTRRVIALIYTGPGAVGRIREICGPTNPHVAREKKPGCIRALGTVVPLLDSQGKQVGERMDNLIHASATAGEAEREIKLWFKPNDIPPAMRIYETETSDEHYYYKRGNLFTTYEQGSTCLLAPGDTVWKSDLEILKAIHAGKKAEQSLETIAAKYMINELGDTPA